MAECDRRVRAAPDDLEGYRCYWERARRYQVWESAARRLEALLEEESTRGGAQLYLAAVRADRGGEAVVALYREAAESFSEKGNDFGELVARAALVGELCTRQRADEAEAEAALAAALAEATGTASHLARARLAQAQAAMAGDQVSRAWVFAKEAEGILLPDGPLELRIELFRMLGFLRWAQREGDAALRDFLRSLDLAEQAGDPYTAAMTRYSAAFLRVNRRPAPGVTREGLLAPMREALEAARQAGNLAAELRCRLILGQGSSGNEALEHLRRASELAELLRDFDRRLFATRLYAYALMASSPERAEEILGLLDETVVLARSRGDLEQTIAAQIGWATAAWVLDEPTRALASVPAALDTIDRARSLQRLDDVRARWHSQYEFFFKRASGWLLQRVASGSGSPAELEQALGIMDRSRARTLLDALEVTAVPANRGPRTGRHVDLLRRIATVQKRLRDPDLIEMERAAALKELDQLEASESALRVAEQSTPDGATGSYPLPRIGLEELRRALRPEEALLTIQLFDRETLVTTEVRDVGSWMVLLSKEGQTVRALPDWPDLEAALGIYLGLVERADGSETEAGAHLYSELFRGALESLPAEVDRLVLVLDPLLEGTPLEPLEPSLGSEPLAGRFELTRVPSLATFLRLRNSPAPRHEVPVLALADPTPETDIGESAVAERSTLLTLAGPLEPLPFARREGRELVRRLRRGSLLRWGEEASESWLKAEDLSRYSVLHFAAHAIVDEADPERSAIVLAPGDDIEDGLLQSRDLADLELDGQLVVLAACRSAVGDVIGGEGAMGLARAFLQAGARTVVASLWPLQDDLAADLFGRFYRRLGEGLEVSAALQAAQRELRQEGIPARGWAGVVVMGDGSLAPVSGTPRWPVRPALAILAAMGLVFVVVLRRRGHRDRGQLAGSRAGPSASVSG